MRASAKEGKGESASKAREAGSAVVSKLPWLAELFVGAFMCRVFLLFVCFGCIEALSRSGGVFQLLKCSAL